MYNIFSSKPLSNNHVFVVNTHIQQNSEVTVYDFFQLINVEHGSPKISADDNDLNNEMVLTRLCSGSI